MRVQWRASIWKLLALLVLLPMTTACAETRLGDMTVREAFPDERVARLIDAVSRRDYTEADKQLKAGANINMVGTDGVSPLIWVSTSRDLEKTEYMLKAGANPNYRDARRGASVMALAAGSDLPELIELLLKYKGDPNLPGTYNQPLLHIAVDEFRKKNVELLLKYGADVNVLHDGDTVAQVAARLGNFELVAYFLEKGLTYNLQGLAKTVEISQVPANSDAQRWKDKVIEMLKERGAKFPAFVPKPAR